MTLVGILFQIKKNLLFSCKFPYQLKAFVPGRKNAWAKTIPAMKGVGCGGDTFGDHRFAPTRTVPEIGPVTLSFEFAWRLHPQRVEERRREIKQAERSISRAKRLLRRHAQKQGNANQLVRDSGRRMKSVSVIQELIT